MVAIGQPMVAIGQPMVAIGRNRSGRWSRFGRNRSRFGGPMVAIGRNRSQSVGPMVAIGRNRSRFGVLGVLVVIRRAGRAGRNRSRFGGPMPTTKARHKKTRFLEEIGLRVFLCVTDLSGRLVPRANRRASARIVQLGRARRWCIVMPTSGRRHIVHYI